MHTKHKTAIMKENRVCVHCFGHIAARLTFRVTVAFEAVYANILAIFVHMCVNGVIRFIIVVVAHNQKFFHHLIYESHQLN